MRTRWRLKALSDCFSLKIYGNYQLGTVLLCPFSLVTELMHFEAHQGH